MRILIVGAGIAGPTLAHWLLKAGHEATIVERAPKPRAGGYLVDFWGAGFDVAERMDLVPELRRRGYVLSGAKVVDRTGRQFAMLRTDKIMGPSQRYVSIARSALADAILTTVSDRAEIVWGDSVVGLDETLNGVDVRFSGGTERSFDLVVGADGLHSVVRRLAFGPDASYLRPLGAAVAAFELRGYPSRDELAAVMHAEVGFQVVRVSLHDDTTLVLVTFRHDGPVPTDNRPAQESLLRATLSRAGWEVPAILDALPEASEIYLDTVAQIRMPSWHRGRVALVGDAGSCPSLLAGQGSALAMAQGYTLAAELASTDDHEAAFARYEHRLSRMLHAKQAGAVGLVAAFAPGNRRQLLLRNAVMRLMGLPKVVDLAMGRSFRDPVELPTFATA